MLRMARSGFKEPWTESSAEAQAGFEQLTYQLPPYTDQWGSWVSAYAPIKDSSGAVVGALGVDYHADYVTQVQQNLLSKFIPPILVTYLALVVLVFLVSRVLTRPLRRLTQAAERTAEGDYAQRLTGPEPAKIDDEISTLTRVFEGMVARVRERVQDLAQKVERLTIEIDESKRQQQVSQIVESDFFQSLQGRADEMRRRKASRSGSDAASDQASM